MFVKYEAKSVEGQTIKTQVTRVPDECPCCHHGIEAIPILAVWFPEIQHDRIEAVYRCPRARCNHLFIAYYVSTSKDNTKLFNFDGVTPYKCRLRVFDKRILDVSPEFVRIWNEAARAESEKLMTLCGVGYRKALEFLIKDYLIANDQSKRQPVTISPLGRCISEHVTDQRVKECAKRAAWLGNDETHYYRKWEDKDVHDLKELIELTLHWILAELRTREILEEMPEEGPAATSD